MCVFADGSLLCDPNTYALTFCGVGIALALLAQSLEVFREMRLI